MTWAKAHLLKAWWPVASFQLSLNKIVAFHIVNPDLCLCKGGQNQIQISWKSYSYRICWTEYKQQKDLHRRQKRIEWKTAYLCETAQGNGLRKGDTNPPERRGAQTYRQWPANTSQLPVHSENVHDVEEQNHNQVAHGDNLEEAVGTVICPWRTIYADECN